MLLIKWDRQYSCLLDIDSAYSLVNMLELHGFDARIFDPATGNRLDPTKGMELYSNQEWHKGRFIKGGWQKLAKLEQQLKQKEQDEKEDRS